MNDNCCLRPLSRKLRNNENITREIHKTFLHKGNEHSDFRFFNCFALFKSVIFNFNSIYRNHIIKNRKEI